ncbi:MAG TPA: hypothetical protein VNP04_31995 [Alphaproteobacteria bacterium]|nr:hypothetical protein [Alphaproteobacteria bacterium]
MPFEYQTVTTPPNQSILMNFSQPIVFYVPSISYYSFSYGNTDHHVQEFGLSLNVNQPSPQQLHIDVTGILQDSSGHTIDNNASTVTVVTLAWVGTNPGTILLANANGISNNGQSGAIALPSSSLSTLQAVLSGFDLAYSSDHHVLYEGSGASAQQNGSTAIILGKAQMGDSSGNRATTATINGGLIAVASGTNPGVGFQVLAGEQTTSQVNVSFPQNLSDAAILMLNNYAAYSGDHHVQTVGAGCTGWSVHGNTVQLENASAFICDHSGHSQDNSKSSVSLLVVGFYA